MLSTMTTSENFFLDRTRSRCSGRSPYDAAVRATHVGGFDVTEIGKTPREDENVGTGRRPLRGSSHRFENPTSLPPLRFFPCTGELRDTRPVMASDEPFCNGEREKNEPLFEESLAKSKPDGESNDLPEEEDSSPFDLSKPLRIDPNVLKLDFSKLSNQVKRACSLDESGLMVRDSFRTKRTSHHLSGGGLLSIVSESGPSKLSPTSRREIFDFEKIPGRSAVGVFLNRISPGLPLGFDSAAKKHRAGTKAAEADGTSSGETESKNPFKNFSDTSSEEENVFLRATTNPFTNADRSSPKESPGNALASLERYENISFSRCSTRPASPALKPSDEQFAYNPFLIDDAGSSEPGHSAASGTRLQRGESKLSPNSGSFILAVPVFPIFHCGISDSSTQTTDDVHPKAPEEPAYQNVSSRLSKFTKRNEHSERNLQCLKFAMKDLRNSGWYYENVSWRESVALLANTEPGTFLVRDSGDPDFLFSLSVQTSRGPTSVRIHYVEGRFRLDAEKKLIPHMPSFDSVVELVDHYVEKTVKNKCDPGAKSSGNAPGHNKLRKSKDQVWIDAQGNVYSNILLVKPLLKKDHFPTLQHSARLVINKLVRKRSNVKVEFEFRVTPVYESSPFQESSFQNDFDDFCPVLNVDALPLSPKLIEYLKEYPFCH